MAGSNGYTHSGSAGKSILLLLRSLVNIVAFGSFWLGIYKLGEPLGILCTAAGGVLLAVCLVWNFFRPMIHRI